jgi:hypothetical protein
MRVAIHQPEHLPWLGFLDKARQADCLVLLDHVQFRKNYFQNRNKIRSSQGALWLTVPVLSKGKSDQAINQVAINNTGEGRWRKKHWDSLRQCYGGAPGWEAHESFFRDLYGRPWERLAELNETIIRYFFGAFNIGARLVRSSEMAATGAKSEMVLSICRKLGATSYLSGVSGRDYLEAKAFERAGIQLLFQEFHHPVYRQRYEPFMPCLSAVDLLMTHPAESRRILEGVGVPGLEEVFH